MFGNNRKNREKGQGLVEYALILVLVAIVVVVIMALLGPAIGSIFSQVTDALGIAENPAGFCDYYSYLPGEHITLYIDEIYFDSHGNEQVLPAGAYTCP